MSHTSNWDFPLGLMTKNILGIEFKYVGKHTLFRFPFGSLFKWLGGYPVDRSQSANFVDAISEIIVKEEEFRLVIAPEGTRSKVQNIKTGFYYIAKKANVPILLIGIDSISKTVRFEKAFHPGDELKTDLIKIFEFFKETKGINPDKTFDFKTAIDGLKQDLAK